MKKLTLLGASLCIASVTMAQKPSEKQDLIIQQQKELKEISMATDQKLDAIIQKQEAMESLYGSDLNMANETTKMSYAYGVTLGDGFKAQGLNSVDYTALVRGFYDAMNQSSGAKMTNADAQKFLNEFMSKRMAEKAAVAKEAGTKWLTENAKKPGVKVTPSGLQYMVLKDATGEKPTATSRVSVHYHGTLTNGTVFDSSVDRGKPITFGLNEVIKGWTEGVQLMSPGAKYRFFVPSDLGYGDRGAGGVIGPNEVLIFEVELIAIEK